METIEIAIQPTPTPRPYASPNEHSSPELYRLHLPSYLAQSSIHSAVSQYITLKHD